MSPGRATLSMPAVVLVGLAVASLSWDLPRPEAGAVHHPTAARRAVLPPPSPAFERVHARLARRARALTPAERRTVARTIVEESRAHGFAPELVLAVIEVESFYDPYAVSSVGALGLMQLMPATGLEVAQRLGIPWHGPRTLFDPVVNVRLGVAYLRELADRFGDVDVALAAYNWGPGHIGRRLRRGTPLPERYVGLVRARYSPAGATGGS